MVAAMKHMASNFSKLEKFKGVNFKIWQKKIYFLLSSISMVYVLTTPMLEDGGDNPTMEQVRNRSKWDNDDYVCRGLILIGMSDSLFTRMLKVLKNYRIPWKPNIWLRMPQVLCIIDKLPPLWKDFKHISKHLKEKLTLIELGNHLHIEESLRAQDNDKPKGNNVAGPLVVNKKCGKPGDLKRDWKAGNDGNKANGSSIKGSVDGSSNPLKSHNMFNKSLQIYYVTYVSEAYFVQDDDVVWWVDSEETVHVSFMSTSELNNSILWHARLGHVHFKRMQDMSKDGLILAFDMDTKKVPNKRNKITPYELWTKRKPNPNYLIVWGCRAVVRLPYPKLKTLGERGIECIFVGYAEHSKAFRFFVIEPNNSVAINSIIESRDAIFDEHRFSLVPRPSQRSLVRGNDDFGGSVVPEKVTNEIVPQSEPELGKSKRHRTPKDFGPEFQLYLIKGTWDEKEAINDEVDSIMGNNTWVLTYLPPGCRPLGEGGNKYHTKDKKKKAKNKQNRARNGKEKVKSKESQPRQSQSHVYKLKKALYGLKHAPKAWSMQTILSLIQQTLVVMSSALSAVTYTYVYTDSESGRAFWGAVDEEISEGGIPRVIVLGYDGLPIQPVAPPSPDYIPGPEDPQTPQVPQDEDEREPMEEGGAFTSPDTTIVVPTDEPVSPPEGTEPAIPPPSTNITIGARITVRPQVSISLPPEAEVERLLAMTTPSLSPPISLSPPSAGERLARCTAPPAHSSPPPVPSPLLSSSGCPTQIQTLKIASTQALINAVTATLPSPPLPPPLYMPPPVDRSDDIPESEQPPHKRLCLSTLGSRYEIGESFTARPTGGQGIDYGFVSTVDAEVRWQGVRDVGYGIRDTWIDLAEAVPEIAPMTVGEVNARVTKLHEHDTQDLYALLEDA
ncbi:zinc finger, CCHC-type containing protein [Tanacetum coccineum]|uniref:Zinc finger, CCHC-type containing protein n=1 Tax=Tanacetum coccineum TaxID=301880 RepID=A0ABQ4Z4Z3_9ASTR